MNVWLQMIHDSTCTFMEHFIQSAFIPKHFLPQLRH